MGAGEFYPNGFLLCRLEPIPNGQPILLVNLHPDCEDEDTRMEEFRIWEEKATESLPGNIPQVNDYTALQCKVYMSSN